MKDERLVSKMEGKAIFFEAPETVWRLNLTDPDPLILRQIYATDTKCTKTRISICKIKKSGVIHPDLH